MVNPLNSFITGGVGVGKSMLIETCRAYLTKTFNAYSGSPDKVVLLAPTGVSAINLVGTTVDYGLSIPINFWKFTTNL